MVYVCEWAAGQSIYLENVASQTRVTIASSSLGQQQQASSSFQTGRWSAPPGVSRSTSGVVVRLFTAHGDRFVQIQGNSISMPNDAPFLGEAQPLLVQQIAAMPASTTSPLTPMAPMTLMSPMSPLPLMKMGDMQMDQTAMTMQMGGMRLEMQPSGRSLNPTRQTDSSEQSDEQSESAVSPRNFCSQCGNGIKPSDRFCANCGHRLT